MGWLIALAVILLVLLLKFSVRVRLRDDTALTIGVGFIRIKLFPRREKTVKLSDYTIEKVRRRKIKEEKKAKRKADKEAKKKQKKSGGKAHLAKSGESAQKKEKRDISDLVDIIIEVVRVFFSRFGHHLHINVRRVHIIVATPDAANTAVLYGTLCGAVQCLFELLYNCTHLSLPKKDEVTVIPDFTSEKIRADIDITFSFRLWQFFDMLIRSGWTYLKRVI